MRRKIKARVKQKGTVSETTTKKVRVSKVNRDNKSKRLEKKVDRTADPINHLTYQPIQISSSSNQNGDCEFKLSKENLLKINNLFSVLSNKLEKNLIFEINRLGVLKVAQEQEGVTAIGYLDIDLIHKPKKSMVFVISKDVIKSLADVVVDFAIITIKDSQLQIVIQETDLELSTIETSEISTINIDLSQFEDNEYLNADVVLDKFSRARNIQVASGGIFEATVRLDKSIHIGSVFYLSEVKEVFKTFEANVSPDFLTHILNIARYAKKNVKFLKNDESIIVANDAGMMYKTAINHIEFPTNISDTFLKEYKKLSSANFDSRVLTTSLAKLQIALFGVGSPEITIKYNPRKTLAEVYVKALNNKKSTDSWRAGDMSKNKISEFGILVELLTNSISILDVGISLEVYESFITISDEEQIIVIATVES